MADLTVIEKYPPGRRIDHPDFGDVSKTTYAKGVITEFQQPDDPGTFGIEWDAWGGGHPPIPAVPEFYPMAVEPMVRVEVEGKGESADFLPLFFHPKAKYWDDGPPAGDSPGQIENLPPNPSQYLMSQDFDKTRGCFRKAWMSFRGGDEVVVMLKEGVPVAVIGFADGVPRVGENILKIVFTKHFEDAYQPAEEHPEPWPDSPETYWSSPAVELTFYVDLLGNRILDDGCYAAYMSSPDFVTPPQLPEPSPDGLNLGLVQECEELVRTENSWTQTNWPIHGAVLETRLVMLDVAVPAGGLLYIFQFLTMVRYQTYDTGEYSHIGDLVAFWVSALPNTPANLKAVRETAASSISALEAYPFTTGGGLFGPWGNNYPGAIPQLDLFLNIRYSFCYLSAINLDTAKFYVRPHTKAELQEAGMWPGGAS